MHRYSGRWRAEPFYVGLEGGDKGIHEDDPSLPSSLSWPRGDLERWRSAGWTLTDGGDAAGDFESAVSPESKLARALGTRQLGRGADEAQEVLPESILRCFLVLFVLLILLGRRRACPTGRAGVLTSLAE